MSVDTTHSSNGRMDCERVARDEVAERYLLGTLTEDESTAFEEHYFECARWFDALQSL